jgi:hypothetical protein
MYFILMIYHSIIITYESIFVVKLIKNNPVVIYSYNNLQAILTFITFTLFKIIFIYLLIEQPLLTIIK